MWGRREMTVWAGLIAQTAVPYLFSRKNERLVLTQKLLIVPHWFSICIFPFWYQSQHCVFLDNNFVFLAPYLTILIFFFPPKKFCHVISSRVALFHIYSN